jgi:predicted acyltransferase
MKESRNLSEAGDQRLVCIDALRGFDMVWIIGGSQVLVALAKGAGAGFPGNLAVQFDHTWGQFHFYDLIMPLFLFIVGIVIPVAFKKRIARGESKKSIYGHVLKRVLILYLLGLVASGYLLTFDVSKIHLWTDTLHAIAMGYLVSSILILELKIKWQIGITTALLFLYWGIMACIPVPGQGTGIYKPDANLALYVDNAILGHFQEGQGWTYIITNLTFICSVMLGVFAGNILLSALAPLKKAGLLSVIGAICMLAGKIWAIKFPVIHHLWTSSFVMVAGGLSYIFLSVFYLVIDVWGYKKWAFPFVVIGMNAIVVYVATHLFDFSIIGNVFVGGLEKYLGPWNDFVQSLAALSVVWLILYWMYRKKTFIKI